MPLTDKGDYAKALFARLHEGVPVPMEAMTPFELEDGTHWQAAANQCHQNVTDLAELFPNTLEAIRGWLVVDYRPHVQRVEFLHHSVVRERATGRLFDPTPQQRLNPDYLFITAVEDGDDYAELVMSLAAGEKLVYAVGATD